MNTAELIGFHRRQLECWPLAALNFEALAGVEKRAVPVGGVQFTLQHNPARIASTGAKVDAASIRQRKCFLCKDNRPSEQIVLDAGEYEILVNPFPIFPLHFTIPAKKHVDQLITANDCRRFADMLDMSRWLQGIALFYNGPHCGASAPDHFHFQGVETAKVPLIGWLDAGTALPYEVMHVETTSTDEAACWFADRVEALRHRPENAGEDEPRFNLWCAFYGDKFHIAMIPRRAHRPDFYGSAPDQILLSPASVDLAGVIIVPSADDFHRKIDGGVVAELLRQTCYANGVL